VSIEIEDVKYEIAQAMLVAEAKPVKKEQSEKE
jgi:hypothetical protein